MSDEIEDIKDEEKAKMTGQDEEKQRRDNGNWVVGLVLVALGLLFLLSNFLPGFSLTNWWAIFILIPALYSLNRAWQSYRRNGRLTKGGRSSLVGGLMILFVALIFLLNLNWGVIWPIFIILAGVGILLQVASR
jgi:LiaF transmembrane domain